MIEIQAPWTNEQVRALNNYQRDNRFHPFTCAHRDQSGHEDHPVLRATTGGWICDACGYQQFWAWDGMMQDPPDPSA